jgi:hypothetical protein
MSKINVVLLSLFAVFAVSAATAGTASASTHAFKIELSEVTTETPIEGDSFSGKLETPVGGLMMDVQCEEDVTSGATINAGGKSKGGIEFKTCAVNEIKEGKKKPVTSCEVVEPVNAKFEDQLIEHSVDEYKGTGEKETFVTLEIKICALAGKYKVKGSQICSTPEAEVEKVIHESICTPGGSKLTQKETTEGTSSSSQLFGVEQLKLASPNSGKKWSAN